MSDPLADLRVAQQEEYNTWFAVAPIYVGNALAYNIGDGVPISNVKLHGYDKVGLVARHGSKPSVAPVTAK